MIQIENAMLEKMVPNLKLPPYSNGREYKYDYYDKSSYGNTPHNSTHVKSDLNENWTRVDNDRENGTQEKSSGSGSQNIK